MRFPARRGAAVAALLASCLTLAGAPSRAFAQNKAAAEALFDEGRRLVTAKDFPAACHKLEESQKLDPGIGTLLYLADCYEKAGMTASAWATFREAASTARAANQGEREQVASKRAAALEPSLARLTVRSVPENDVPGLEVKRDGELVPRALWGTAVPVDPGTHEVTATAPGRKPWSSKTAVAAKASATLLIPALESAPVAAAPIAPAAAPSAPPPPAPESAPQPSSSRRTVALIVGGVGLVGVAVGTVAGLKAASKNSDADAQCRPEAPTLCNQQGADLGDQAKSAAKLSTLGFVLGGAAVATGAVLWLTAPDAKGTALRATPMADAHGGGVALQGNLW